MRSSRPPAGPPPHTPVRIVAPYDVTRTHRIPGAASGETLLAYCARRFPWRPPEQWRERIQDGRVRVEGVRVDPSHRLLAGRTIQFDARQVVEPAVPDQVEVLHQDDRWIVVDKPAPLPVHSGGRYLHNTLLSILQERLDGPILPVHRLDSVTTGLLCLARSAEAAEAFARQTSAGRIRKGYLASVHGLPEHDTAEIHVPIRRKEGFVFECVPSDGSPPTNGAKPALTRLRVLARDPAAGRSLVSCVPVTGRTHQLRLHLRAWGHPVHDDPIYGPEGDDSGRTLQNRPISLRSSLLEAPSLGLSWHLPVPADWGFDPDTISRPFDGLFEDVPEAGGDDGSAWAGGRDTQDWPAPSVRPPSPLDR